MHIVVNKTTDYIHNYTHSYTNTGGGGLVNPYVQPILDTGAFIYLQLRCTQQYNYHSVLYTRIVHTVVTVHYIALFVYCLCIFI